MAGPSGVQAHAQALCLVYPFCMICIIGAGASQVIEAAGPISIGTLSINDNLLPNGG